MTVAAGFEPRFSWATVASLAAGVRGARVSWAHLRCVWLLATCFQRAGSGLAATSHLKEGELIFLCLRDFGLLLDKAVSKGCKQAEQPLPRRPSPKGREERGASPGRYINHQSGVGCNFSRSATGSSESLSEPWGYAALGLDLAEKCPGRPKRKDCRAGGL